MNRFEWIQVLSILDVRHNQVCGSDCATETQVTCACSFLYNQVCGSGCATETQVPWKKAGHLYNCDPIFIGKRTAISARSVDLREQVQLSSH